MKIFLLAPSYLHLYIPIKEELERQGHSVTYYEDLVDLPQWVYSWKNKAFSLSSNPAIVYWKIRFYGKYRMIFRQKYDLFFCINGVSFHPVLQRFLKIRNRRLYSSLYVWDTSKCFDYYRHYNCFDNVKTFDIDDSEKYNVGFLPFYWIPFQKTETNVSEDYMLSIVGTNHDGRLGIVEKIAKQLDDGNLSYCFKLYDTLETSPFCISEQLPFDETIDVMMRSRCILDTDRPTQTGTTPRVIWALALGKKIISTNTNLSRMSFYNENYIRLIDRNNPSVDLDFLRNDETNTDIQSKAFIDGLRIDKWVTNFFP